MPLGNKTCIVVERTLRLTEEGANYISVVIDTKGKTVVSSSSRQLSCLSTCLLHFAQLLERDQVKPEEVRWHLPIGKPKGLEVLRNDAGEYLAKVALECPEVEEFRISVGGIRSSFVQRVE